MPTNRDAGSQVAALNWQRYDKGVQINEAMFVGSGGWVLKPDTLLGDKVGENATHTTFTCMIVSGCNSACHGYSNPKSTDMSIQYR